MGFGTAIRTCFTNYATFTGRARRSEFWWFLLFFVVGRAASAMLDEAHGRGPMVEWAFVLVCLMPLVAAATRRLHDTGRSGAWILLGIPLMPLHRVAPGAPPLPGLILLLAALLATVVLVTFLAERGDPAPNRFGPPDVPLSPLPS